MPNVSDADIVNQAIEYYGGDQPPVTGVSPTFDNSVAGQVAQKVYVPCVRAVARQFGWDFSRSLVSLTLSGNIAPYLWAYEYLYPSMGVQIWQLIPPAQSDLNNPLPVNWDVGNVLVNGVQTKVIWANLPSAMAAYNNQPAPSTWDDGFREAVVRLLASEMAMGVAGKPDTSEGLLQSGSAFETIAEGRGEN